MVDVCMHIYFKPLWETHLFWPSCHRQIFVLLEWASLAGFSLHYEHCKTTGGFKTRQEQGHLILICLPTAWLQCMTTGSLSCFLHRNSSPPRLKSHLTLSGPWCVAEGHRWEAKGYNLWHRVKFATCSCWFRLLISKLGLEWRFFIVGW